MQILKLRDLSYKFENVSYKVNIAPDRTKKQREVYKGLREKLKSMKEDGKENLAIRNYKIVQIQPFRFKPQEYWGEDDDEESLC